MYFNLLTLERFDQRLRDVIFNLLRKWILALRPACIPHEKHQERK
jgi:hypothetical protein